MNGFPLQRLGQMLEPEPGNPLEAEGGTFHRLRQSGIDEELFDVISGYEALSEGRDGEGIVDAALAGH